MKNPNISLVLASLLFAFLFVACEAKDPVGHEHITFINLSDSDIYVMERWQGKIIQTDTFFTCWNFGKILAPGDSLLSESTDPTWELDFKKYIPFIQYFVFSDRQPFNNCHEDSIQVFTERYQLKRYLLTKEDLDDLNWVITYP